jgi:hypothetical protein
MIFSVDSFAAAFAQAPRPPREAIAPHDCEECEGVRRDFAKYSVAEMPDDVVEHHADSIPLLGPAAFRHYLPRYVRLTCEKPSTNVRDFLLFGLSPDDPSSAFWSGRFDAYTRGECEAVVSYLEHRRTWPEGGLEEEWIAPALAYWRRLLSER